MRSPSLFGRLKDAIMGPPVPAHLRKPTIGPLYIRLWNSLRPPKSPGGQPLGLNRSQRRLVSASLSVAALLILAAGVYFYIFAGQEERSMAAFQEGMKSVARVDYQEAVERFSEAISIWPGNAQAYLHRGNSYAALGETVEAKRNWDQATRLNPELADAYTARGTQNRIQGDTQQALNELSRAIQLRPSVDAYYQRGRLYSTLGDYRKAIEDFDRAIAERPDAPYVYRARGAARRAIGDTEGAAGDRAIADRIEGTRPNPFSVR